MELNDRKYGLCYLDIQIEESSVDAFITQGYSESLGRDLTEDEIDDLNYRHSDSVQEYSYLNGSVSHN